MRNILFETVLLQQIGDNIERFYLRAHLHFLISFLHFLPPFLTLKVIFLPLVSVHDHLPLLQTASLYVLSSSFLQKHFQRFVMNMMDSVLIFSFRPVEGP